MKILRFTVDGFCNIDNSTIELNKINSIIALNNFGKSNLIRGLAFAEDFILEVPKKKSSLMRYKHLIPINNNLSNRNFLFDIEFETVLNNENVLVNYNFSFEWIKNIKTKGGRIVSENLKFMPLKKDARYKTVIKRNITNSLYQSAITGRCDNSIKIAKNELIINKLSNYDDLFYFDIINDINNLNLAIVESLGSPDNLFRTISDYIPENSLEMPISANTSYFLFHLKKTKPKLFELFKNSVISLLPNIDDFEPVELNLKSEIDLDSDEPEIPYDLPENVYDIMIKEHTNNQQTTIAQVSSGSKKIFYVLAMIIAGEINKVPLITFEEIENSIHPALLQRLLIIIDAVCENTKVLITSHSPYLIKYLDIDDINIGIPNSEGVAKFKKVKKSKQNKLMNYARDEENSLGDFIFDKLLESINDFEFFNEFVD